MKKKTKRAIERKLKAASKSVSNATDAVLDSPSNIKAAAAAATGIVALGAAGVATVRALRKKSAELPDGGTVFRVEPADNDGWILTGDGRSDQRFENKRTALKAARAVAAAEQPSQLVVHRSDGRVQRTHSY